MTQEDAESRNLSLVFSVSVIIILGVVLDHLARPVREQSLRSGVIAH